MKRVLLVSQGDDVGGVGTASVRAIEEYGSGAWTARAIRGSDNYIQYPADLTFTRERFLAEYARADVVHCMESFENVLRAAGLSKPDRPYVLHHHGSALRDGPAVAAQAERLGIPQYCSTVDLELVRAGIEWIGNPIPVSFFEEWGRRMRPSEQEPFTVAHTPTFRSVKGTAAFLVAARHARVGTVIVEREPWIVALDGKARAHAYFDQLAYGFGLSALEAWSMHRPVVAGVERDAVSMHMIERWGRLPFLPVQSVEQIEQALRGLAGDLDLRADAAEGGHAFVREHHDEPIVAARWERAWSEALA
jgi:SAM-dependent methyltransferase